MEIIVINNKGQYNHRIHRTLHYLKISSQLIPNTISVKDLNDLKPAGIILGGGPSLETSGNCQEFVEEIDIPILGICLGHQIIAKTFGGEVSTADVESYAQVKIKIIEENDILRGLGPSMKVWASHKDEVKSLPKVFDVLATSDICDVEAMKHKNKPIYGIQFHPEVYHTERGPEVFQNFYKVCQEFNSKN